MVEKIEWLLEHWDQIGGIVATVVALLTGKKWLAARRGVEVLTQANEGYEGTWIRKRVEERLLEEAPSVRDLVENFAAKSDPDIGPARKSPSVKKALKGLLPDLGRVLIGRLFKRR